MSRKRPFNSSSQTCFKKAEECSDLYMKYRVPEDLEAVAYWMDQAIARKEYIPHLDCFAVDGQDFISVPLLLHYPSHLIKNTLKRLDLMIDMDDPSRFEFVRDLLLRFWPKELTSLAIISKQHKIKDSKLTISKLAPLLRQPNITHFCNILFRLVDDDKTASFPNIKMFEQCHDQPMEHSWQTLQRWFPCLEWCPFDDRTKNCNTDLAMVFPHLKYAHNPPVDAIQYAENLVWLKLGPVHNARLLRRPNIRHSLQELNISSIWSFRLGQEILDLLDSHSAPVLRILQLSFHVANCKNNASNFSFERQRIASTLLEKLDGLQLLTLSGLNFELSELNQLLQRPPKNLVELHILQQQNYETAAFVAVHLQYAQIQIASTDTNVFEPIHPKSKAYHRAWCMAVLAMCWFRANQHHPLVLSGLGFISCSLIFSLISKCLF